MQDPHVVFEQLKDAYNKGIFSSESVKLRADQIQPYPESQLVRASELTNEERGKEILQSQAFGRLFLNGGMATRFGGRVKGVCEVYDGKSFIELKLQQMTRLEQEYDIPEIPVVFMNSFATHEATEAFLRKNNYFGRLRIEMFLQPDAPRLTKEGQLYRGEKNRAARGHGDFAHAFQASGLLNVWIEQGITHIDFSNIDNIGATVNPRMVAAFVDSGKSMGVEVAQKDPGDKGGSVGLKDGRAGIIEGFYFPNEDSQNQLTHFNTNNLWFDLRALNTLLQDPDFDLPWSVVEKVVHDPVLGEQEVIQFEHVAADISFAFNATPSDDNVLFFWVERDGKEGRFFPVKRPEDLQQLQDVLRARMQELY